ncbi:MAG: carboxypeptidase regulatory-like domain-containing protein [Planctomycetes bacterium]|nr:carboxypeptidase regulatory-like domain-containing protein [Planctomycetota bacterium]
MPRRIVFALVVAALAVAGILVWTSREPAPDAHPGLAPPGRDALVAPMRLPPTDELRVPRPLAPDGDALAGASPAAPDAPASHAAVAAVPRGSVTIEGVVLDERGDPLPLAWLWAWTSHAIGEVGQLVPPHVRAQADALGRFALALPEGEFTLAAFLPPTHVVTLGAEGVARAFAPPRDVRLVASRGLALDGVVHDAQGRPVERALVDFVHEVDVERASSESSATGAPDDDAGWRPRAFGTRHGFTDASGAYHVDELAFVPYRVHVESPAHAPLDVAWTASDTPPVLVLDAGLTLAGRVLGPDGEGLSGARVSAYQDEHECVATSAADGAFTLTGLVAGDADLLVAGPGCALLARDALAVPRDEGPLELALQPEHVLAGRVLSPDGTPRPDLLVVLRREPPGVGALAHDTRALETKVRTDADGRFRFGGLDDARFRVSVRDRSRPPVEAVRVSPVDVDDLALVLDPLGGPRARLVGAVRDASDGTPLDDFTLRVQATMPDAPPVERTFGDAGGRFAVDDLPIGAARLVVTSDGWAPASLELRLVPGENTVDVELQPARRLALHVVDARGRDLAGAELALFDADTDVSPSMLAARRVRPLAHTKSDEAGRAAFDDLPPTPLNLVVAFRGVPLEHLFSTTLDAPGAASERLVVVPDPSTPDGWREVAVTILVATHAGAAPEIDALDADAAADALAALDDGSLALPDVPVTLALRGADGVERRARLVQLAQVGWMADGDAEPLPDRREGPPVVRMLITRAAQELVVEADGCRTRHVGLAAVPPGEVSTPQVCVVLERD